jgi:hypothetical protein
MWQNFASFTEDLSNAAGWLSLNVTEVGAQDSINGVSLTEITDDATLGNHRSTLLNYIPEDVYYAPRGIWSIYAKAGTATHIHLGMRNSGVTDSFNLSTGAWDDTDNWDGHGFTDLGNGYYRIWFYHDTLALADNDPVVGMSNGTESYSGTGDTIYAGGLMVEGDPTGGRTSPGTYTANTGSGSSNGYPVAIEGASTKGLLVEEARTNICLQSEDFGTTWANNNSIDNSNQAVAPDGATTADQLIDDSAGGAAGVQVTQNLSFDASTAYTVSCFMKADQLTWSRIALINMSTLDITAYFDLSNGVVGATLGADNDDQGIEDYGNGWYRCWISFTSHGTDLTGTVSLLCADGNGDSQCDRDGTSSIYMWGAQVEAGAFPTSYITTTTASATRNDDVVSTTDVSWANSNGTGSWYTSGYMSNGAGVGGSTNDFGIWQLSALTTQRLCCFLNNGSAIPTWSNSGWTGSNMSISGNAQGNYAAGDPIQWAMGFAEDDAQLYQEGLPNTADTDCDITPGFTFTTFYVGYATLSVAKPWNGHVSEMAYYNTRLDNPTLEGLSAGTIDVNSAGDDLQFRRRRLRSRQLQLAGKRVWY